MKNLNAPMLWVVLIGMVTYNVINAFVVVDTSHTYVKNEVLFSEFKLTKEYEVKLDKIKQERQAILDSIEVKIRQSKAVISEISSPEEIQSHNSLVIEYESLNTRFTEQNALLVGQYDDIIWKQLNTYVQNYGEEKGHVIIFGTSGDGNLMYADNSLDVTEELITYVNGKYDGK